MIIELTKPLPNWNLESIFGDEVPSVEDFKGKPLLILIFSLGCPGCKGRAIPYANRVVVENGEKVNVVGIHTRFEGPEYGLQDFEKLKEEYYVRFPFFKDANLAETFHKYRAGGTPHWLLLDKDGNLKLSIFGSDPNNALLRLDLTLAEMLQQEQVSE